MRSLYFNEPIPQTSFPLIEVIIDKEPEQRRFNLASFPDDILGEFFSFLESIDLISCESVSRNWRQIATSPLCNPIWKGAFCREFDHLYIRRGTMTWRECFIQKKKNMTKKIPFTILKKVDGCFPKRCHPLVIFEESDHSYKKNGLSKYNSCTSIVSGNLMVQKCLASSKEITAFYFNSNPPCWLSSLQFLGLTACLFQAVIISIACFKGCKGDYQNPQNQLSARQLFHYSKLKVRNEINICSSSCSIL